MPITNQKAPESDHYRSTYDGIYRKLHEIMMKRQLVTLFGDRLCLEGYIRNNERPGQDNIRHWSIVSGQSACPFFTAEVDNLLRVNDMWFLYLKEGLL